MFVNFFLELRQNKVPATLREYLTLIEAVKRNVAGYSVEDFYYLSRATLVKDEKNLDKEPQTFDAGITVTAPPNRGQTTSGTATLGQCAISEFGTGGTCWCATVLGATSPSPLKRGLRPKPKFSRKETSGESWVSPSASFL